MNGTIWGSSSVKSQVLPSQIPSKRSLSSRSGPKKKRKIDLRLQLQKAAQENEDEKEAEDPETPGDPNEM